MTVRPSHATPAEWLWDVGSRQGAAACGFTDDGGVVRLRRDAIDLALVADEHLLDALVFGSTARVFDGVVFD